MPRNAGSCRRAIATALTLLGLGCGDGSAGPSGSSGSIQVTLTPAVLTLTQGRSGSLTVSVLRGDGFSGLVTLAITGLPTGVTGTVTPPQLPAPASSATLELAAATSVAIGTYSAAVTATGEGAAPATATFQLTVSAAPNYALAVAPAALTIDAGGSGNATITIDRTAFTGGVALAFRNPPAGVTGVFTPTPATMNTSALVVSVAANTAPGGYPITIEGSAGAQVRTATLTVTVAGTGAYAIEPNPANVTVPRGASGTVSVTLSRTNFTSTVNLALENAPAGVTGAFEPASTTGNASALTIAVGAQVAPGSYPLSLRGTAPGLADRVAVVQLTVPQPAGAAAVEFQYCDPSGVPLFFAYQDGTGSWQALEGSASGGAVRFAFSVAQGRGGVLAVLPGSVVIPGGPRAQTASMTGMASMSAGLRAKLRARLANARMGAAPVQASAVPGHLTEVLYASAAELAQYGAESCARTRPPKTATGAVQGIPEGSFGIVSLGYATEYIDEETSNPITFSNVQAGVVDLVGTRSTASGSPPDKILVLRNVDVPDGGSLPATIDFNGPASSLPAVATVTVLGGGGEDLEVYNELVTSNGPTLFWFDGEPSPNTARPWTGLRPSAMSSGEFHSIYVFTVEESLGYRVAVKYVGPVADQIVALGPAIDPAAATPIAAGAYPRYRFQGSLPAAYGEGASVEVLSGHDSGNVFRIFASGAYLSGSGAPRSYDFTMPDVAGLAGFPGAARLTSGSNHLLVSGFGFDGAGIIEPAPMLGTEYRAAVNAATINVP